MAPLAAQNKVLFISGPAATDAITGINKYTFRSGRQTYQDVKTAATFLKGTGKNVVVFAQDSAFGAGNFSAVNADRRRRRATRSAGCSCRCRRRTSRRSPSRRSRPNPDLLFVAWAGTTAPAMWRALEQQGVFGGLEQDRHRARRARDVDELRRRRRRRSTSSRTTSTTAPKNKVNDFLVRSMRKREPGAGPVHAGRLRRRPDDRARAPEAQAATTSTR